MLSELPGTSQAAGTKWFSEIGCVVKDGDDRQVFVGGMLVGRFEVGDTAARNVLLINLAFDRRQHLGRLARAFEIGESTLGEIRRRYAQGGLDEIARVYKPGGKKPKLGARQRRALERRFEQGKRVPELLEYAERKYGVKRTTLYALWRTWRARKDGEGEAGAVETASSEQQDLELVPMTISEETDAEPQAVTEGDDDPGSAHDVTSSVVEPTIDDEPVRVVPVADAPLPTGTTHHVQHAGSWLMLAMLMQLGLYDVITTVATARGVSTKGLRAVLDALVVALSVGERCVEGVRRIATPTAGVLLRAKSAPSPQWVRRVLGRVATAYTSIAEAMTQRYLAVAAEGELAVYYVDNHMRPYTGKHTVRKGWRMQDKRVRPGTSDYYVHDLDGRPVLRVTEPSHGHLTDFLRPIADKLRRALGLETTIVLAFDRGGAYPVAMAELRDAGVHFVTYERKPFPLLSWTVFEPDGVVRIGDEVYTVYENRRKNLGKGRGRVRRIAVLTPKGTQINLLAVSDLPAQTLLRIMLGRWRQENGFKHGNERWGINQLDGRTVVAYDPDTVIPNPARRRLDAAIRVARVREGDARRKLAELPEGHARRDKLEQDIVEAMEDQRQLLELRPQAPKHIELKSSELAGELVHHTSEYKGLIDIARIACANMESHLAVMLGPSLSRSEEAKKVLANLFAAPGTIRVSARTIRITLAPAATEREQQALAQLLERLDDDELVLPGDPDRRRLRFRIAG